MLKVTFTHNRKKKLNAKGQALVQMRLYLDRQEKYITTGIYLKPSEWDSKRQRVKSHPLAPKYNKSLADLEQTALTAYFDLKDTATLSRVVQKLKSDDNQDDFIQFVRNIIQQNKTVERSTLRSHELLINYLERYNKRLPFKKITYSYLINFQAFLQKQVSERKKPLSQNYIALLLRIFRGYVTEAINTIKEATGEHVLRSVSPGQQFIKIVHDRIVGLLGDERADLQLKGPDTTSVILLLGLQGSGKTTTASKLAKHIKKQGRRPMLVAADLVRPAAVDQLVTLGANLDIEVYHEVGAKDPVKVAKAGLKEAKKGQFDTVIIDTSGRMHVDDALMKELKSVYAAVKPDETLLVADAMTGQHAVDIAKNFDEALNLSGVILSKFDSDTRGGAALSLKSITGKAIKFIGVGEKADDLEAFIPERIASRILGMGDVVSLVEKAQETIDEQEAIELQKKNGQQEFYAGRLS
jgi:signal recognition particle GTPase